MTTSPAHPSTPVTEGRVALRLRLHPPGGEGPLDGAWWPQSRDLAREGADLVDHFPREVGRIQRLLVSPPDWDAAPDAPRVRALRAARGPVKVGAFPRDDTHLMILILAPGVRLHLLVIPSEMDTARAEELMTRATTGLGDTGVPALLGLS